ncbi:hypothetical protein FS837_001018 [Tulasnella sp. UAMH 9824]|nr:hypothetical protein FS837_001018 [Tulasnella sp. UAMH 9824]
MTEIKSPQKDMVFRAISTFVEGICEENDCDLRFSGIEWADAVPVRCLGTFRDELKAVQARMNQQIDKIISRLAQRWNIVSPSIHKLPLEVLVMILGEFEPSDPNRPANTNDLTPPPSGYQPAKETSLFDLLLVCRTWYDAILGSPGLWGYFDGTMTPKIASLVIDRSQLLPISVRWDTYRTSRRCNTFNFASFVEMALKNSMRVRSIDISVSWWDYVSMRELLVAPTPALETLQVRVQLSDYEVEQNRSSGEFTLSDGPHLKHLSLHNAITQMDHPRLSHLIALALTGLSVPKSPKQLLHILSRLQRLEELDVRYSENNTGGVGASGPILLPCLKRLALGCLPSVYTATILASIYTPSCSHILVQDWKVDEENVAAVEALDAVVWRPGNNQSASLVGGSSSRSERSALTVQKLFGHILLQSPTSLNESRELHFARRDIPRFMTQLATTISQSPSPPAVELVDVHYEDGRIPVDLLLWSEVLESLVVRGHHACRSTLQQLSQRHVIPGTGEVDWVCKKLSKINLEYTWNEGGDEATDGRALLSLVRQRWSGEDGFVGTVRPSSFEVYCKEADFPSLWSLKDEITHILPSFKLIGHGF